MTDQALDSMLRRVLLDVDCQQYGEAIDELPECDFSPAFEKKMQKLIRRADHPIRYRVTQAVACLLLAALLSGCTVLAISPEAREAFVGWVREVSEAGFFYHYTGEEQTAPENVVYCPTWVPDGYELITEPEARTHMIAIYENSEGDKIIFNCYMNVESMNLQIGEGAQLIDTCVGNIPADLYIDNASGDVNHLVWEDENKQMIFWIASTLDGETMTKIAESVEAQEIPKPQVVFRPTWIPDGYQAVKTDDRDTSTYIFYENGEYAITFSCIIDVDAATLYIQSVDGDALHVKVGDLPADLHIDPEENASSAIVWTNENGNLFLIHGPLSGDELIRMAESVEAKEIPKPLEVYRPTWIPDGYSQALVPELSGQVNVTGDTHGGFQRFTTDNFLQQKKMGRNDYVIICGDFGGVWDGSPREAYWLDWLEEKPFTTLFVDGNHENFTMLNALPQKEWHGGKVHEVRPNVLHLMRGQTFEIDGLTFFTMGGAASHDVQDGILDPASPGFEREYWFKRRTRQMFRVKGVSWWPEELPSEEEYEEAIRSLERVRWQVDCILTHCAPTSIVEKMDKGYDPDRLTDFLEMLRQRCRFDYWFLGHYHRNCVIDDRFVIQWEQMVELNWE